MGKELARNQLLSMTDKIGLAFWVKTVDVQKFVPLFKNLLWPVNVLDEYVNMIRVKSYPQQKVRNCFCFLIICSVFQKFTQIFHVVLLSKISMNNFQKYVPAACTKESAHNFFRFLKKKFEVSNFFVFYRKISRAKNILDGI